MEVINMFTAQIVVMVSQAHINSYQVVYINYVQLFLCQSYLYKIFLSKSFYLTILSTTQI